MREPSKYFFLFSLELLLSACDCGVGYNLAGDGREEAVVDEVGGQSDEGIEAEPAEEDPVIEVFDPPAEEGEESCGNGIVDEGEDCEPGDIDSRDCGMCGESVRSCTGLCVWGEWGECENETGQCEPDQLVECLTPCGTPGTTVCTYACEIQDAGCCMPLSTTEEICFNGLDDDCDGNIDMKDLGPGAMVSDENRIAMAPTLSWTGTEYGLVWSEGDGDISDVYFSRLDAGGSRLGGQVRLSDSLLPSSWPKLVWNGSEFAAAWGSLVVWDSGMDITDQVFFTRVSPEGVELGEDMRISHTESWAYFGSSPSPLVWTGSEYGMVWEDSRDGIYAIYFARIDAYGVKIGEETQVTDPLEDSRSMSLVWSGSEFGIVWATLTTEDESGKVYFARLDETGVKMGGDVMISELESGYGDTLIAWNGSGYGVFWNSGHNSPYSFEYAEQFFARLSASGERIGGNVRLNDCIFPQWAKVVSWSGSEYVLVLFDFLYESDLLNEELFILRVGEDGEKLGSRMRLTFDVHNSRDPSLALAGTSYAVAWMDDRDGDYGIYFTRVGCE